MGDLEEFHVLACGNTEYVDASTVKTSCRPANGNAAHVMHGTVTIRLETGVNCHSNLEMPWQCGIWHWNLRH